jgi:transcriptional regulator with XRE-family HTH domain
LAEKERPVGPDVQRLQPRSTESDAFRPIRYSRDLASRIRYIRDVAPIHPYLGDIAHDDEKNAGIGRRMPTLASALVVQARQLTGLTQVQLAERAGTSRRAISAIEHGKRDPGLEGLQKILVAAGFDLLAHVAPHDDHDDVLKALDTRLDPETRRKRKAAMREFPVATLLATVLHLARTPCTYYAIYLDFFGGPCGT